MLRVFVATLILVLAEQAAPRTDTGLQRVIVTVRDSQGQLVQNLGAKDFNVEEDGVTVPVAQFVQDNDTPVSLGFLIDISSSMGRFSLNSPNALRTAIGATRLTIRLMKPTDEFVVMSFSNGFSVDVPFTGDKEKLTAGLGKLTPYGGTDLFPAVGKALKELKKAQHRKKALILMTDAIADGNFDDLQRAVRDSELLVYTFALPNRNPLFSMLAPNSSAANQDRFDRILETLARESGGRSETFDMGSDQVIERMIKFVQDIAAELRGQYTLGYYSKDLAAPSRHVLRIRTVSPDYRVRFQRDALLKD